MSVITITVVDHEQYDHGPFCFDGPLTHVIDTLLTIKESIPLKYRETAHCEIDSVSGYEGSSYAHIQISYSRPETEKETADRMQAERDKASKLAERERATLAQLKAKYE